MILPSYDRQYWFYLQHGDNPWFKFTNDSLEGHYNAGTMKSVSFSVEEEEFAYPICRFSILDNVGLSSKIFLRGQPWKISWGLDFGNSFLEFQNSLARDELNGITKRTMQAFSLAPGGHFQNGQHIRDVTLRLGRGMDDRQLYADRFTSGTVKNVIQEMASRLGCKRSLISFPRSENIAVTLRNPLIMNNETVLQFLRRMSEKYNAKLVIQQFNYDPILIFIDWDLQTRANFGALRELQGSIHYFDYGNTQSNIIGDPKYDFGTGSSMGSNISFVTLPDGQQALQFSAAGQETTTNYVLNMEEVNKAASGGNGIQILQEVLEASMGDFIDDNGQIKAPFKRYFLSQENQTVPEQMGWQFEFETVPNPFIQAGDMAWLGPKTQGGESVLPPEVKSFRVGSPGALWRIHSTKWTHDGSGVKQEVKLRR